MHRLLHVCLQHGPTRVCLAVVPRVRCGGLLVCCLSYASIILSKLDLGNFLALKFLNWYCNIKIILLLISFSVDFMIYQTCKLYKHIFNQCLITLASSYIMLIYSTKTFSNTLELFLTSLLVYLVIFVFNMSYLLVDYWYMDGDDYDISLIIPQCVLCLCL